MQHFARRTEGEPLEQVCWVAHPDETDPTLLADPGRDDWQVKAPTTPCTARVWKPFGLARPDLELMVAPSHAAVPSPDAPKSLPLCACLPFLPRPPPL